MNKLRADDVNLVEAKQCWKKFMVMDIIQRGIIVAACTSSDNVSMRESRNLIEFADYLRDEHRTKVRRLREKYKANFTVIKETV